MKEPSQIDWARLAAYIDGEGCIEIYEGRSRQYKHFSIKVSVFNTDPRLPLWCKERFGGRIHKRKRQKAHWRCAFSWIVGSHLAAEIVRNCYPYFILKREQAELLFAFIETIGTRGHKVPQQVQLHRRELKNQMNSLKWTERELPVN